MNASIALITGASRGLGRSMALHLARQGVDIIGTYHTSKDAADAVASEVEAVGAKAAMLPFDAEAADLDPFVVSVTQTLRGSFGRETLTHLVNNAGIGAYASFSDTTAETLEQMFRIHVRTPFMLTRALLPTLEDGGSVLFVSSGLARFTLPGYAAYACAKGAVDVLTRYAAKELGGRKIRVNALAPGAIETDFGGGAVRDNPDLNAFIASNTAMGRVGQPPDIGSAAAALLSDQMAWMTGERVEVSGGQSL